jgi:hypothetical protein
MEKKKPRVKNKSTNRNEVTEKPMKNTTDLNDNTIAPDHNKGAEQHVEINAMPSGDAVQEKDESNVTSPNGNVEVHEDLKLTEQQISTVKDALSVSQDNFSVGDQSIAQQKRETDPGVFSSASATIQMLSHPNEKLRIEAIESLLRIADKSLGYAFATAMKDESHRVRLGALRGLYKFGGDLATDYLLKALEDINPDVRRRALIYLGWMRKKEFVPYVTSALADASSRVRRVATYALSDIKDSAAVPYLIKALDDSDQEVVKGAIAALKRITSKSFGSEQKSLGAAQKEIVAQYKEWWQQENQ